MKAVTIRARTIIPQGCVYVMPNTEHLEVSLWTTLDEAEHLIVACHVDDERRVRDAVAVAQETPKWWLGPSPVRRSDYPRAAAHPRQGEPRCLTAREPSRPREQVGCRRACAGRSVLRFSSRAKPAERRFPSARRGSDAPPFEQGRARWHRAARSSATRG